MRFQTNSFGNPTRKEFNDFVKYVEGRLPLVGPGLEGKQTSAGHIISAVKQAQNNIVGDVTYNPPAQPLWFFGRVTAAEYTTEDVDADTGRRIAKWTYTIIPVGKSEDNAGWEDITIKIYSISTSANVDCDEVTAYNLIEQNNPGTSGGHTGSGLHGNGIDTSNADLPDGLIIQPVPVGTKVVVYRAVHALSTPPGRFSETHYIQYENGLDGSC
jgi:hypothetical protein